MFLCQQLPFAGREVSSRSHITAAIYQHPYSTLEAIILDCFHVDNSASCAPALDIAPALVIACRLPMIHQNSMRFYNDIAYDKEYNGLVLDEDEGQHVALTVWLAFRLGWQILMTAFYIAQHICLHQVCSANKCIILASSVHNCSSVAATLVCSSVCSACQLARSSREQRHHFVALIKVRDAQYQGHKCDAGNRIAKVMDGRRVHLHANHGVIIATETIGEAFDYLYYLERAAEVTIKALSTGKPLKLIDEAVCAMTHEKFVDSGIAAEVRLLVLPVHITQLHNEAQREGSKLFDTVNCLSLLGSCSCFMRTLCQLSHSCKYCFISVCVSWHAMLTVS